MAKNSTAAPNEPIQAPSISESQLQSAMKPLRDRRRVPTTTYRLQMHKGFGFRDAAAILPYLAKLGVTDCYTSPLLKAAPGSTHGYDITDHNQLNPELGSTNDYESFAQKLQENGIGHVLDFVPNHMGVHPESNPWWNDVLENGPASPYARFFDIDWDPLKPELKNKVLLPILGDQYGKVLERGELQLIFEEGLLALKYFEHRLPINPRQTPKVLRHGLEALEAELKDDSHLREFLSVLTELTNLPSAHDPSPERIAERQREKEVARERLARVSRASPRIQEHILNAVKFFNGIPGVPASFDALHHLLEEQYYRLSYWRTASHEINYRRFFDINQLAGLRMEAKEVFDATHALVFKLIGEGRVLGLRLDHPDGLYDPARYFDELQERFLDEWIARQGKALSDAEKNAVAAWRGQLQKKDPSALAARPLFIVCEKILSTGESLPARWALDGSSGYDFLNDLNRLFVDGRHADRFREFYMQFTGKRAPLDVVIYVCKRLIMSTTMASELNVLAHALNRISEDDRSTRDFTLDSLRDALREVVACFPVYRTYISETECTDSDRQVIDRAIRRALRRNPAMESSTFEFVRSALIPHDTPQLSPKAFARRTAFAMKFQQYTGPVQAKGLEDTAFYRYAALLSLNEVGGDPRRFGSSVKEFHELNRRRALEWPHTMNTTATHDTKRGEDARARLNVLSEIPDEWQRIVRQWSALTGGARTRIEDDIFPEINDEYFFYQALLGAWPADPVAERREDFCRRLQDYMNKAIKEAKLRTSWISADESYEKAVHDYIERVLLGEASKLFLPAFEPFARKIAAWGAANSLTQVVLKAASPGVSDFYQGTELWDLSFVDPDNRRPVDYERREKMLEELEPLLSRDSPESFDADFHALLEKWPDGRIKLFVTAAMLRLRQRQPNLFLQGDYIPLDAMGERADHAVAFARHFEKDAIVVIVPRLIASLPGANPWATGRFNWTDTTVALPDEWANASFTNLFTGESARAEHGRLALAGIFRLCPVAVLVFEGSAPDRRAPGRRSWLSIFRRFLRGSDGRRR